MENSIFFAKFLGLFFIIVAVGILFNLKTYRKMMKDFCKNSSLLYFGGIIALFFGLIIALRHNVWVANWPVIITIFGWCGIIKGAWLIILPNTAAKFTEAYLKKSGSLVISLLVIAALGIFLTIMGF